MMETFRLSRAIQQFLEQGVEALESTNQSGTTTDRSAPLAKTKDVSSRS